MSTLDPSRLSDGWLSVEAGIDSGFPATVIQPNQFAFAVNTTFRGGYPKCRPGWKKRPIQFRGDLTLKGNFEDKYFQGAGTFTDQSGTVFLAASVAGRIFLIDIADSFNIYDRTIAGDANDARLKHAWFQQAGPYLIVQDNLDRPYLWDGATARRAVPGIEVPTGGPMAFGKGRLWVARDNLYFGGDLIGSDPTLGTSNVIQFTENDFLNEGGAFATPGTITGMAFAANIDTSLGDGDLLVFNNRNIFAFSAPEDRTVWKNLNYPIQRFAILNFGSVNHESIVAVNGDLIFRALDGVRSMIYARRDFGMWGNTPISRQAKRCLDWDSRDLLGGTSAVNFDNRMLMTVCQQNDDAHGIYCRGLISLDYDLVSGMGQKLPPAWEGIWTGLKILRILTVLQGDVERCFAFALNDGGKIELWELSRDDEFDNDGVQDVPIQWLFETKSYSFNDTNNLKKLITFDGFYDEVVGTVSSNIFFRGNLSKCWTPWTRLDDCAKFRDCDPAPPGQCQVPTHYQPQSRNRISAPLAPDVQDPQSGGFTNEGYEFQLRFENTGHFRFKRGVVVCNDRQQSVYGDISKSDCVALPASECQTGCVGVSCCDRNDFGYCIEESVQGCCDSSYESFRFAMVGDSGEVISGSLNDTKKVSDAIIAEGVDFMVHLGDSNYPSGSPATIQSNFLNFYGSFLPDNLYIAFGNHDLDTDYGLSLLDKLPEPKRLIGDSKIGLRNMWYDFCRGPVHFFVLNSGNTAATDAMNPALDGYMNFAAQALWLENALKNSGAAWKIVLIHRAPYNSGTDHYPGSATARLAYKPWGADAVFSGHGHDYEHLKVATLDYFVCGLGGATRQPMSGSGPVAGSLLFYYAKNGYLLCTGDRGTLTVTMKTFDGTVVDVVTLTK